LRREITLIAQSLPASHQRYSAPRRRFITFTYISNIKGRSDISAFSKLSPKRISFSVRTCFQIFSENGKKKFNIQFKILTAKEHLSALLLKSTEKSVEPTIPASERAKTVHASDRAATVSGIFAIYFFQWLFQPIQGPGLLFSSVIIFHSRYDSLDE
jgi:hypothetical protein